MTKQGWCVNREGKAGWLSYVGPRHFVYNWAILFGQKRCANNRPRCCILMPDTGHQYPDCPIPVQSLCIKGVNAIFLLWIPDDIVHYNGPLVIFCHVVYATLGYSSNSACSTTSVKAGWI